MDWLGFAGSILGGIVGGLFTYLGVKLTIKHEDKIRKEEDDKQAYRTRPRLEIEGYLHGEVNEVGYVNFGVLLLNFDVSISKENQISFKYKVIDNNMKFAFYEYTFKNTGDTEIQSLYLVSNNHKTTSIFNFNNYDNSIKKEFISYSILFDNLSIKSDGIFTIRFYLLQNEAPMSIVSALVSIYLEDINGKIWKQPLFCPDKKIENSIRSSHKELRNSSDEEKAIKCFKGEIPW